MARDRDTEAAAWLSRLRTRSVGNSDLAEFARWRRLPGSAEAYERAERLWTDSEALADDPEIAEALADAMMPRRVWWRSPTALAGAMAAAVLVCVIIGMRLLNPAPHVDRFRTALGERSSVELADGSKLQVDADSEVKVSIGSDVRKIDLLRGQALFAVRHDAARPFVVSTPSGVTVTALGTRFDVEITGGGNVAVSLLEGRVAVRLHERLVSELTPGQSIAVSPRGLTEGRAGGARDSVDWTQGRLVLRDETLRAAVDRMNRYSDRRIAISSDASADERLSGEFSIDDPDAFVRAVEALLGPGTITRGAPG